MVYIFDNVAALTENDIEKAMSFMPKKRKDKIRRYHFLKDQKNSCAVYLLFLYGLMKERKIQTEYLLDISVDEDFYGKPFLKERDDLYFNFSHCEEAAACVISDYPVGIDIQEYENDADEKVMKIVFSSGEINDIKNNDFPGKRFTAFWTLKESYFKCTGYGINDEMNKLDLSALLNGASFYNGFFFQTVHRENYCISLCVNGTECSKTAFENVSYEEIHEFIILCCQAVHRLTE